MAVTLQDCITESRGILQDTDATAYRVSDADMVIYGNGALFTIALHRPDLFSTYGEITLTASETLQSAPAASLRLMEIIRVKAGRVVKECDHDDLDSYDVNWHTVTASASTKNWVRHPRDPNKFYVSPPPTAGVILIGQWAVSPTIIAAGAAIPIPDAYKPIIAEYIVWRAESRDDEYVSSPRAAMFLEVWKSNLGVSARTKATADSDVGNRDMQKAMAATQQQALPAFNPQAMQSAAQANAAAY